MTGSLQQRREVENIVGTGRGTPGRRTEEVKRYSVPEDDMKIIL